MLFHSSRATLSCLIERCTRTAGFRTMQFIFSSEKKNKWRSDQFDELFPVLILRREKKRLSSYSMIPFLKSSFIILFSPLQTHNFILNSMFTSHVTAVTTPKFLKGNTHLLIFGPRAMSFPIPQICIQIFSKYISHLKLKYKKKYIDAKILFAPSCSTTKRAFIEMSVNFHVCTVSSPQHVPITVLLFFVDGVKLVHSECHALWSVIWLQCLHRLQFIGMQMMPIIE